MVAVETTVDGDSAVFNHEKAGASGSLKSLQQFVLEKGSEQTIRFNLNPPSKMRVDVNARSGDSVEDVRFELLSFPLYSVEVFL